MLTVQSGLLNLLTTRRTVLLALLLIAVTSASACDGVFSPPPRVAQNLSYTTLAEMQAAADRIVTAEVTGSSPETIVNPDTGDFLENIVYYSVTIVESFKGSSETGDELNIALDAELTFTLNAEPRTLQSGARYLLFLNGRARAFQYPVAYGGTLWRLNGEPSIAELTGETATFWQRSDFSTTRAPTISELSLDTLR